MLILLPPSEKKRPGGRGRSLTTRPDAGELAEYRARTIDAVRQLVAGPRQTAAAKLLLPDSVVDETVAINRALLDSPTMPALQRYSGVVYDGLDAAALSAAATSLARRRVLIFSGLFGVLTGGEPIPNYRVPAKAVLPGIGVAGTFWRPALDGRLRGLIKRGAVIDLRSSDYASMWRMPALDGRGVSVRIESPTSRGYGVVSYNSKYGKGVLARALLERVAAGGEVSGAEEALEVWREATGESGEVRQTCSGATLLLLRTGPTGG
ncbi:hypothetical protein SAMN05892883_3288 [Jatrophihabitans sp. GAS493]|uniref:YaaA family protein n=1 Tax=Jatrophihabitans sp. GAS493 TaxID=1907575 RepID=UPI000BB9A4E1|nr:peroxide stress protein YaaA [Jatrophihabitans sp. GAS493]SOD74112.1 hypothetical protein SAMN05892883_3288 [Jatrophihabitans sp. GAS493]